MKHDTSILQGREVLVVDDNATNRRVLEHMLLYWKMRPTVVESGEAAIGVLTERQYEYIVLDTQMPDMDGPGVAQFLGSMQSTLQKCSIIMMLSSTAQRGILEQHADLPVSVYLNKPIGQGELLEALLKPFEKKIQKENYSLPRDSVKLEGASKQSIIKKDGKILLAEDNVVNQRLALRMLEKLGYTVSLAENGLKAVQAVEEYQDFDLILMDVQMPEMGGFEATQKIREIEAKRKKRTPIIAMTAHAIQGYREKCLEGGMDGYISKPIHMESVKKTIEEYMEKGRKYKYTEPVEKKR